MLPEPEARGQADLTRISLGLIINVPFVEMLKREITCEKCGLNDTCEYAFDHYNTDGGCIVEAGVPGD